MDESVYLNLAKADILCGLANKDLTIDNIKYLDRQLNDSNKTHIMIFEIYKNLNTNVEVENIDCIKSNECDFICQILDMIKRSCGVNIDYEFDTSLWIYSTYLKFNENISVKDKGEYLKNISPPFNVGRYFLLEYYNCLMDTIMQDTPINVDELIDVKNKIRDLI